MTIQLILIIIASVILICSILSLILIKFVINKRIDELTTTMFFQYKHISNDNTSLNNQLTLLSTSINEYLKEIYTELNKKVYPTPQIADMIQQTISDYLTIEFTLLKNNRIPNRKAVNEIIQHTCLTYPNINEEYITKKTLAIIEKFSSNK